MRRLLLTGLIATGCRFGFEDAGPDDVAIACTLVLEPGPARINTNARLTITATGGRAPFVFSTDSTLATIDSATGELAAFDRPGSVEVSVVDADSCTASASLTLGGDVLWYAGGSSNNVPTRQVLRSTDGSSWTVAGMLPAPRQYGALVTFRDRLWWISGTDGMNPRNDIYVSDDGATWSVAGTVPTAASAFGFTVFQDQLWFVGGNNNTNRVYRSDDAVTWTLVGTLPMNNHGGSLAAVNGQLIYCGGHDGALFDWVLASPDGVTWTEVGQLAIPREYHGATVIGDRMYIAGGQNTVPTALASVASTTDGIAWTVEPPLPAGRAFSPLVSFNAKLWSLGGTDLAGVYVATPSGPWSTMPSTFPAPRQGGAVALFSPPN